VAEIPYIGAAERIYPVYKLIPLSAHLAAAGIGAEQTLAGSGITVADLDDPYFFVSRQQVATVFGNFLRLTPGTISPLELGASFHLTDYGFYGYALLSSATVRDAIDFGMAYRELATPIVEVELSFADGEAAWLIRPLPDFAPHEAMARFVLEYQSGILLALHKSVSGNAFRLRSASFGFAVPDSAAHYHTVLNCPIVFDAPQTELRFDQAWLEHRPLGAHAITFQLVRETCREMLERIGGGRGVVGEIYRHLLSRSGQFATLEEMAGYLDLHPRTLRRKIISEGTTYQEIIDEVRFKLASGYLTRTEMTHESISERLGFSDASSFRRAFKRWAGVSPNQFKSR
jgi:AraC-like DNA-binding protein